MTALTEEILNRFDTLPASEKLEIAVEILRRTINFEFPALTDEDLILNAEELFLALDHREEEDDSSIARLVGWISEA